MSIASTHVLKESVTRGAILELKNPDKEPFNAFILEFDFLTQYLYMDLPQVTPKLVMKDALCREK